MTYSDAPDAALGSPTAAATRPVFDGYLAMTRSAKPARMAR